MDEDQDASELKVVGNSEGVPSHLFNLIKPSNPTLQRMIVPELR